MTGVHFANTRSAHVTLSCSVSSGGGFGDVTEMCIANAADNIKGILSNDIDNWEEVNSLSAAANLVSGDLRFRIQLNKLNQPELYQSRTISTRGIPCIVALESPEVHPASIAPTLSVHRP